MTRKSQGAIEDRVVVVTGASSGLGRAMALHLDSLGYRVYGGVRNAAAGDELRREATPRLRTVLVDVTDEESVHAAAAQIAGERPADSGVFAIVNNAGVCVASPLECVKMDRLRHQLRVNVVGPILMSQAFLPLLRRTSGSRIVNVSSGMGKVAMPYLGSYAAAEFGKEAASASLRRELARHGVAVSIVAPGAVKTPIWEKVSEEGAADLESLEPWAQEAYGRSFAGLLRVNAMRARASTTTPTDVARTVARVLAASRPRARYTVGVDSWLSSVASRVLPDGVFDAVFAGLLRGQRLIDSGRNG
ncbi:MAG TPA: SDR family NAD(P)-dependent oxidoreductase [Labilithrix sp.]|nr:SDR family NAD(P)-dependent oxidoreductase [Labilithrix sp.]